jgi:hypothetical protein
MTRDDRHTDLVGLCRSILTAGLPTPPARMVNTPAPDVAHDPALDDYRCPNGCGSHKCKGSCEPGSDRQSRWGGW